MTDKSASEPGSAGEFDLDAIKRTAGQYDKPWKWADAHPDDALAVLRNGGSALVRGGPGTQTAAQRRGILDSVCAHMAPGAGTDNDSLYLWAVTSRPPEVAEEWVDLNGLPATMVDGKLCAPVKIGVASWRLVDWRIKACATRNNHASKTIAHATARTRL